jgi:hypothetical protein
MPCRSGTAISANRICVPATIEARASAPPAIVAPHCAPGDNAWGAMPAPRRAYQPDSHDRPCNHRCAFYRLTVDGERPKPSCDPPCRPAGRNATGNLFALPKPQRYQSLGVALERFLHSGPISDRRRFCSSFQAIERCPLHTHHSSITPIVQSAASALTISGKSPQCAYLLI